MRYILVIACLSMIKINSMALTLNEKIDLLYLLEQNSNADNFKRDLKGHIENLKSYENLSNAKKIKKIYNDTQSKYLKYYSLYSFFPDISKKGQFNCVSGSALYAVILDELKIPYQIIEIPNHVYLVAYPGLNDIAIESTSSKNGVYAWTENNKQFAIAYLINNDKVSLEEVKYKGMDAVINEYFESNVYENFESIVGMQLFNRALLLSDRNDFTGALESIRLSEQYYTSDKVQLLCGGILLNLLDEIDYENVKALDYITAYFDVTSSRNEKKRMMHNFEFIVQEALVKRRDYSFVDSAYYYIDVNLSGDSKNEFISIVEKVKAVWYYNRQQNDKAYESAKIALEKNPKNKELEDIFAVCLIKHIYNITDYEYEFTDSILKFETAYPFLIEIPEYVNLKITICAELAADFFNDDSFDEAMEYLVLMEQLLSNDLIDKNEVYPWVADAYGEYATYLYRLEEYEEAMVQIEKALFYDPESELNLRRKQNILDEM